MGFFLLLAKTISMSASGNGLSDEVNGQRFVNTSLTGSAQNGWVLGGNSSWVRDSGFGGGWFDLRADGQIWEMRVVRGFRLVARQGG